MAQLPIGAEGAAAGVLIWSFTCLSANVLLQWLLWTGNERRSYLMVVCFITLLSTSSSIIQQIYDIIYYEDMQYARLAWVKANQGNAMMITMDGTTPGVDMTMWSIRWGCYIAECGIAYFWSFTLCQAVYGWRDDARFDRLLRVISAAGKVIPIIAATLTMVILQIEALQQSYFWWNFVLNFFYCLFCAGSLFWFSLMFIEYFQTRRLFRRMNSQQRRDYERQPTMGMSKSRARSNSTTTSIATVGRMPTSEHFGALAQRQGGIYDNFLIARTFIPAIALTLFEIDNILLNSQNPENIQQLALKTVPDLTAATARSHFGSFIPGCLASLILALAFGTTKNNRQRLYQLFMPRRWQSAVRRHKYRKSTEYTYQAMDSDNGILSRQKRLSMEKRLRIEVTYEFEIRNESAEVHVTQPERASTSQTKLSYWDDTTTILPTFLQQRQR